MNPNKCTGFWGPLLFNVGLCSFEELLGKVASPEFIVVEPSDEEIVIQGSFEEAASQYVGLSRLLNGRL